MRWSTHLNPSAGRLELGASIRLTAGLCLAHLTAVLLIWISGAAWVPGAALSAALAASLAHGVRVHGLRTASKALLEVEWGEEAGRLRFRARDGTAGFGKVLDSSFVAPYLTILNIQPDGRSMAWHAVLIPDAVDPEGFRRFRVWLRYRGQAQSEE